MAIHTGIAPQHLVDADPTMLFEMFDVIAEQAKRAKREAEQAKRDQKRGGRR